MTARIRSADRLRRLLAASGNASHMYQTEALYKVQVEYTCDLLDAVDEVTDEVTAQMITAVIYEKLTGDGASAAARRKREADERIVELMQNPGPTVRWPPPGPRSETS